MKLSLLLELVSYWINFNIVSPNNAGKEMNPTHSKRDLKRFVNNLTFVAAHGHKTTNTSNEIKMETRRIPPGKILQRRVTKSLNSTCNTKEDKVNYSQNISYSIGTTETHYTINSEEPRKIAERTKRALPLDFSKVCKFFIYISLFTSIENPCGRSSKDIHINYQCGMSCLEKGDVTDCRMYEIIDCKIMYQCYMGTYIPFSKLCDGTKDCQSNDDEKHCIGPSDHCTCVSAKINCAHLPTRNSSKDIEPFNNESVGISLSDFSDINPRAPLSSLVLLHCSREQLTYVIDEWCQIGGCSALQQLAISNSDLPSSALLTIAGLSKLRVLQLSNSGISSLPVDIFGDLSIYTLNLSSNVISFLPEGIFNGLLLRWLDLSSNQISVLPDGIFNGLRLRRLDLSSNKIYSLTVDIFKGLLLGRLNLSSNRISFLPVGIFDGLPLSRLDLSSNRICSLPGGVFRGLPLTRLYLSSNKISSLLVGVFTTNLFSENSVIDLSFNEISSIPIHVFNELQLNKLDLSSNRISSLSEGVFRGLHSRYLSLANNDIIHIPDGSFGGVAMLEILVLNQNKLEITERMFEGLNNLTHLIIDTYMLCCVKPKSVPYGNCLATSDNSSCIKHQPYGFVVMGSDCSAPTTAISSCTAIIGSNVLRLFLWVIGMLALVGNMGVVIYRLVNDKENLKKSYTVFVLNLSVSDVLMGVYMLMIGAADVHYRGAYAWNDRKWRRSTLCITAGILSTISSEMSTFVILLITIDRFVVLVFPFTQHKLTWKGAVCISFVLWIIAFTIAIIPQVTLQSYFKSGFYSKSGVCLALPLTDDTDGVEYSMLIFVGLNSCIFIVIMVGHIVIYKSISSSACPNTHNRKSDITVAKTLFLVVATDFCCWIPIGIMGILSQAGIQTPDDIYAWIMIFVLPINSAINPFIYTFIYVWRKWRERRRRPRMAYTVTTSSRSQRRTCATNV